VWIRGVLHWGVRPVRAAIASHTSALFSPETLDAVASSFHPRAVPIAPFAPQVRSSVPSSPICPLPFTGPRFFNPLYAPIGGHWVLVWKILRHEFHIPKQDKISTSCVRKHFICELKPRGTPAAVEHYCVARDCWRLVSPHVCHIGLHVTTTQISSMWPAKATGKMYHWHPEHDCVMVLRHISSALCEKFSVTSVSIDG
jgi:hypothetical protein